MTQYLRAAGAGAEPQSTSGQGRPMTRLHKTLAAAAAIGLLLAACSDPGAGNTGSSAPASWPAETAKLDNVNLTIWAAQNSNTVAKKVAEKFGAATGAKVTIVTVPDPYEQSVQTK